MEDRPYISPAIINPDGSSAVENVFEVARDTPLPAHNHAVVDYLNGGPDIVKECPESGVAYQSPYEYDGQILTNCPVDGQTFHLVVDEETNQECWVEKE